MNFLKTTVLLATLTGLLVAIGGLIGGTGGMIFALIFAGVMNFTAYWFSDKMALRMAGAHEVTEAQEPHLHNMIREVANLANMPMPRAYVIQNESPHSFATGRSPSRSAVAVSTGPLETLNREE